MAIALTFKAGSTALATDELGNLECKVGDSVSVSGTGFTSAGSIEIEAYQEGRSGMYAKSAQAASGGALDFSAGKFIVIPGSEGHLHIKITDVTAVVTTDTRIKVFTQ
jgi:hypothetical protein